MERESPMITAFPPPKFNPEIEFLYVIPLERRNTSFKASISLLYIHIRVPPKAGPRTVLCTAIIAFRPVAVSLQNNNCSWLYILI
ncbi:hypothetical protein D3C71_738380 [compost metagenome]